MAYRNLLNDGEIVTSKNLKEELDKLLNKDQQVKEDYTFLTFIQSYIDQVSDEGMPAIITTYKTTLKHLSEYARLKRVKLDFDAINESFYYDFKSYQIREKKFVNNTIGKQIKAFMTVAFDRKLTSKLDYKSKYFRADREDTFQMYLTNEELEAIYNLDLSSSKYKYLDKVSDLFLITYNPDFSFSDYNIRHKNIREKDGRKFIWMKTFKTGDEVMVPINPIVEAICAKYDWILQKHLSNQKTNEYLKTIGELAEINHVVSITTNSGNKRTDSAVKKFEMITTHTARRSFATNAYLEGVPTISIMKMTGQKSSCFRWSQRGSHSRQT